MNRMTSNQKAAQKYFLDGTDSSTLINKHGITDKEKLQKFEALNVERVLSKGLSAESRVVSPAGLHSMHKQMFENVYDWAGKTRDYNTQRGGLDFCFSHHIDNQMTILYGELNDKIDGNVPKDTLVKEGARFIGELNMIHPFIDGNGRTQRETLALVADKAGFELDPNTLNKEDWYKSAEMSVVGDYSGFESIISNSVTAKSDNVYENTKHLSASDLNSVMSGAAATEMLKRDLLDVAPTNTSTNDLSDQTIDYFHEMLAHSDDLGFMIDDLNENSHEWDSKEIDDVQKLIYIDANRYVEATEMLIDKLQHADNVEPKILKEIIDDSIGNHDKTSRIIEDSMKAGVYQPSDSEKETLQTHFEDINRQFTELRVDVRNEIVHSSDLLTKPT